MLLRSGPRLNRKAEILAVAPLQILLFREGHYIAMPFCSTHILHVTAKLHMFIRFTKCCRPIAKYDKQLRYHRYTARRRSLRHSKSFNEIDVATNRILHATSD